MSLWDSVKNLSQKAGNVAMIGANRTKLRTEILLLDRDVRCRQQSFGVALYDFVEPMVQKPEFFSSDDRLTNTLRPSLLEAQREIMSLRLRMRKLKEEQAQAEVKRAGSFTTPATTWGGKMVNAGKSASLAGNETKIKTEMAVVDTQIKGHKQQFGINMFAIYVKLEDESEWLPTDRKIRSIYDQCRQDIEKIKEKRKAKEQELIDLGGSAVPEASYDAPTPEANNTASSSAGGPASLSTQSATNHSTDMFSKGPPAVASETPIVYATPAPAPAASTTSSGGGATNNASGMFGFPPPTATPQTQASASTMQATNNNNHVNATGIFAYPGSNGSNAPNNNTPATMQATPVSSNNNDFNNIFGFPAVSSNNSATNNGAAAAPTNMFASPPSSTPSDPFADLLS